MTAAATRHRTRFIRRRMAPSGAPISDWRVEVVVKFSEHMEAQPRRQVGPHLSSFVTSAEAGALAVGRGLQRLPSHPRPDPRRREFLRRAGDAKWTFGLDWRT